MSTGHSPPTQVVRSSIQRSLEALAITGFVVLWLALAAEVAATPLFSGATLARLALAALLGLLAADLTSGLLHFGCDAFFDPRTPWIGRWLIAPFRDHHEDPPGIARHAFCERNGNNCGATLPLLSGALLLPEAIDAPAHTFVLSLTLATAATNQIHAWAHAERTPRLVAALQRVGLLLRPSAHAAHHRGAHDRAYCITTGWLNPWLDRVDAFPRLERLLRTLKRTSNGALGRAR